MPPRLAFTRTLPASLALATWFARFAAPATAQTFTPVSNPDLAAHVSFSLGASWVDVDGDDDLDLYVVTGFSGNNANVLYRNDAGTLVRVTSGPLVQDGADTACSTWADVDNDGDLDAYVSNLGSQGGMFFRGLGNGAFTLATPSVLTDPALKGTGCAFGDYDNDGHADLVVAALFGAAGIATGNRLFHNNGDGSFSEVTSGPVVTTTDSHHHPTWSDFDGDGDLDLFFGTGGAGGIKTDRFYRNQWAETGTATFTPITTAPLATDLRDSQQIVWVDYDNDGDLDMFAVNYSTVPNQLYRNDGGTFVKLTTAAGPIVAEIAAHHGAVWGDFDNDGDQDCFVVTDLGNFDKFYRNQGNGTFVKVSTGTIVTQALSAYGVTAGDYDRDGDLDLFVPTARSEGPSQLFRNDLATGAHWVRVRCEGTLANRSALGAKVRLRAVIGGQPRWQMREILASGSYGGQSALEAHFGLGDATLVDTLRVEWPGGGVEELTNLPVDRRLDLVQGHATLASPPSPGSRGLALALTPNPSRAQASAVMSLGVACEAELSVLDLSGRNVIEPRREWLPAGQHRWPLALPAARPAGVYLVRVRSGAHVVTRRWAVLR